MAIVMRRRASRGVVLGAILVEHLPERTSQKGDLAKAISRVLPHRDILTLFIDDVVSSSTPTPSSEHLRIRFSSGLGLRPKSRLR